MGSGCSNSSAESQGCRPTLSAKCVKYQGPAINIGGFQVCNGDSVNELLQFLIEQLVKEAEGQGVELTEITYNCPLVQEAFAGKNKTVLNLIQGILDLQCTLQENIQAVDDKIEKPFSFSVKCLTTPITPSRNEIIQAIINKVCENTTALENITSELGDTEDIYANVEDIVGNVLLNMISSCSNNIVKTGTGATASITLTAQNPIGTYLWGDFPLSAFDGTGKGKASEGYCGWTLCDGRNGTWDMRGFTAAGATNIGGGTLLPMVQPGSDPDLITNIGAIKGQYKVTLTSSQLPDHNHNITINDPGHAHQEDSYPVNSIIGKGGSSATNNQTLVRKDTSTSTTGITANISGVTGGSNQPHENRQPTRFGVWIKRIS